MFGFKKTFASFSTDDLDEAQRFYGDVLGLDVRREGDMGLVLEFAGGMEVFIYPKRDHEPASFTVLNFEVDDIDAAVDELNNRGIAPERYEGIPADEKGIMRGLSKNQGPDIAWFADPAGNILSVLQSG